MLSCSNFKFKVFELKSQKFWPDLKLLHHSAEENEEFLFRQSLTEARSLSNSESDDAIVVDESAVRIDEPVGIEDLRILELIWTQFYYTFLYAIYEFS